MIGLALKALPLLAKVTPFLGILKTKAKLIGVVVSILSVLWIVHLNNKIDRLHEDKTVLEGQVTECLEANETNLVTINELWSANEAFALSLEISEEERIEAVSAAAAREARSAIRLDNTLSEMEKIRNANPTCKQLSEIDMGSACPLVVERLRQHAAGSNQD